MTSLMRRFTVDSSKWAVFVTDDDDDVDGWMSFIKSRLSGLLQSVGSFEYKLNVLWKPFGSFFFPLKIITRTNEKILPVWS